MGWAGELQSCAVEMGRVLYATKEEKSDPVLYIKFSSRAHKEKGICYQESVSLFLCWRGVSWAPGNRAEPNEGLDHLENTAGASIPHWHSFPGEGSLAASHAGLKLKEEGDAALHEAWWGIQNSIRKETWDGAARGAKGRGKLAAPAPEPGAGRAALLCDSALCAQRATSSWDSLAPSGFWAKYVSPRHKRNKLCCFMLVAYVIPGNSCSDRAGIRLRNKWDGSFRRRNPGSCLPVTKMISSLARWGQNSPRPAVYHQKCSGRLALAVPYITTPCWSKNRKELAADVPGQLATDAEAKAHRMQTLFPCIWEDKRPDSGPLV